MAEIGTPSTLMARVAFPLLAVWFVILWIAGGASRPDVIGQPIVRAAGWAIVVILILFGDWERWKRLWAPILFVMAAILIVVLQLVPLPPAFWQALPGRDILHQADAIVGQEGVWRPISLAPALTLNALGSLIVPLATLGLAAHLSPADDRRTLALLSAVIMASSLLAAFQVSGGLFDHPFVNDISGEVGGSFANRNHMAALVALGCIMLPTWATQRGGRRATYLLAASFAAVAFFILLLLGIGSRTGIVLGLIGVGLGFTVNRKVIAEQLARWSKAQRIGIYATSGAILAGAVALSFSMQRAVTIDRALGSTGGEELRGQALPVVASMIEKYFPVGSGFGTFDPAFRIDEPLDMLRIQYLNLAHNDLVQVWLDGGILGGMILLAGLAWLAVTGRRAWRTGGAVTARLGLAVLVLIVLASATDYPARTPMVMAIIAVCAAWLTRGAADRAHGIEYRRPARPSNNHAGLPRRAPSL